jgi:hypothetical protein
MTTSPIENLTPTNYNPSKMGFLEQQIYNVLAVWVRALLTQGVAIPVSAISGLSQAQETAAINAANPALAITPIASPTIGQATVNAGTPVQIHSGSVALNKGVTLSTPSTNTHTVYAGLTGVSTSTGFPIPPDSSVLIPVNNINLLYIVAPALDITDVVGFVAT